MLNDKYYFRACAFFRQKGKIKETDMPSVLRRAQELRDEHTRRCNMHKDIPNEEVSQTEVNEVAASNVEAVAQG